VVPPVIVESRQGGRSRHGFHFENIQRCPLVRSLRRTARLRQSCYRNRRSD
jgi:hypothetical protein